ncbi:hypothetical protein EJB05_33330, partial [Eragrostis curvula]
MVQSGSGGGTTPCGGTASSTATSLARSPTAPTSYRNYMMWRANESPSKVEETNFQAADFDFIRVVQWMKASYLLRLTSVIDTYFCLPFLVYVCLKNRMSKQNSSDCE